MVKPYEIIGGPEYIVKKSGAIKVKFHQKPRQAPDRVIHEIDNKKIALIINKNETIYDVRYVEENGDLGHRVDNLYYEVVGQPYKLF